MLLEDYFEFNNDTSIQVKGTRIGLEIVVEAYEAGASADEIVLRYPTLMPEQVHAAILYYLANQIEVKKYLLRVRQQRKTAFQQWQENPQGGASPFVSDLRKRLATARTKANNANVEVVAHEATVLT